MTEAARPKGHAASRRQRLSKRALRAWAWIAGATAVFAPLGLIAAQPKVATAAADAGPRTVIVKKTVRRVIVVSPKANPAPQRVVYVGGGSSGGGAAPAPVTTTGGSAPPP
jgi:hypothetical protein